MINAGGPEGPGGFPRIAVKRTPANDVYLLLTGLGLGPYAEQALEDPVGFLTANRAEARTVAQLLQARVEAAIAQLDGAHPAAPSPGADPSPPAQRPAWRPPARDEAGRLLRSTPSLLR